MQLSTRSAALRLTYISYSLNDNFGTADDLNNLASALHDRGMYLMVDVVANHMVRFFFPFFSGRII